LSVEPKAKEHWSAIVNAISNTARFFRDLQVKKIRDRIWREYIWNYDPNFRYPQRFLAALVMLVITGYDVAVFWGIRAFELSPTLACTFATLTEGEDQASDPGRVWRTINRNLIGACLCTFLLCLFQVYLFLKSFKHDIIQIRRGRFPRAHMLKNAQMNDALRFMGYQVGYGFFGSLVNLAFVSLVFLFFSAMVNIPDFVTLIWEGFMEFALAPLVFALVFVILQAQLTRVFMSGYSGFYVKHRRSFQFYDYAFVFVNMVRGLISFTTRLLISVAIILVFCYRMDKPLIPEGFHMFDFGYTSYLGLLAVSQHYNNPISLSFVYFLRFARRRGHGQLLVMPFSHLQKETNPNSVRNSLLDSSDDIYTETPDPTESGAQTQPLGLSRFLRVRNKFHLVITLTNNPGLIAYRKHNLQFN